MEGFITLQRKILEWEWYKEANTKIVFIHLLLKANYESKNWHGIEIKRGELVTSLGKIAEETGLSMRQTRTALEHLKSTNNVTIRTTNRFTLVSVVNYDMYQDKKQKTTSETTSNETINRQAKGGQSDNNITNILNNNKQIKKENIKERKTFDDLINEYTENESLRQELRNHLATRRAKKATLTNRAIELSFMTLNRLTTNDDTKIKIVRQSIERGWTGFFQLKEDKPAPSKRTYDDFNQFYST